MTDKCVSLQDLTAIVERRRAQGQKIVFTNGCFDVLHVGHIRSLQAGRATIVRQVIPMRPKACCRFPFPMERSFLLKWPILTTYGNRAS